MIKLSEKERHVFLAIQCDASASIAEIAERCGYPQHQVRYCIDSLIARSVLQTSLVVDEAKLGLLHIKVLLKLEIPRELPFERIESEFAALPGVAWLGRCGGEYSHYLALWVWNLEQMEAFFDLVYARFGRIVTRHSLAEARGWNYFGAKFLVSKNSTIPVLTTGFSRAPVPLDRTDLELIALLAENPLGAVRDLARAMSMASSSLTYRIAQLRAKGVIGPALHRMQVANTGLVAYFANLKSKYVSRDLYCRLLEFAKGHQHIVEMARCFGAWDYSLEIAAEDPDGIYRTVTEVSAQFGDSIDRLTLIPRFADLTWTFQIRKILATAPGLEKA
jgi:DNA-binding Lrp family transcriptional regulator